MSLLLQKCHWGALISPWEGGALIQRGQGSGKCSHLDLGTLESDVSHLDWEDSRVKFHGRMDWGGVCGTQIPVEYSPFPSSHCWNKAGIILGMLGSHPASSWALFRAQFSPKNPKPKQPNPNSSSQNSQHSLGAELGSFQIPGNPDYSSHLAPTHSMEKTGKIHIQECKINPKYLKPPRQVEGRAQLQQNLLLWIHEFPFPAVAQGAKEVEKGIYPIFWKLAEICSMPFSILVPRGLAYGKKKIWKKGKKMKIKREKKKKGKKLRKKGKKWEKR